MHRRSLWLGVRVLPDDTPCRPNARWPLRPSKLIEGFLRWCAGVAHVFVNVMPELLEHWSVLAESSMGTLLDVREANLSLDARRVCLLCGRRPFLEAGLRSLYIPKELPDE
jgi:hypothetical protein